MIGCRAARPARDLHGATETRSGEEPGGGRSDAAGTPTVTCAVHRASAGAGAHPPAHVHVAAHRARSPPFGAAQSSLALVLLGCRRSVARMDRRGSRDGPRPTPGVGRRPPQTALRAGVRPVDCLSLLGVVLARGVRLGAPDRSAAAVRLRVRRAAHVVPARHLYAGLRTVSDYLQHQSLPVVQAGLVLSSVCDGGGRLRGQRAAPVDQGRAADPHLQSVVVSARPVLDRLDPHGDDASDVGSGNCHDAPLSSAHLPAHLPRQRAGSVPVRGRIDDIGGRYDDLCVQPGVLRRDGYLLLPRFVHPDRGLSRHAPPLQRPLDVTAE